MHAEAAVDFVITDERDGDGVVEVDCEASEVSVVVAVAITVKD